MADKKTSILDLTTTGTSGPSTFNPATMVLNIPQYSGGGEGDDIISASFVNGLMTLTKASSATITATINDGAADGIHKGIATFAAEDFESGSGAISIDYVHTQQATAIQNGVLSSTDWVIFSNKYPGLPSQAGNAGKFLTTDGTNESWANVASGGAVWGTITGTLSAQTDLQTALNLKANISSLSTVATSGLFADLLSKPTTIAGYGITDYNSLWDTRLGTKTTDNLTQGSTNFYYTETKFNTSLATKTSDDLTEGSTNLYYTTVRSALKEDVANKATSTSLGTSNTLYPSQNAVKVYVDTAISGISGFVPTTRTLTINGSALDLTVDRSWSVGTLTNFSVTDSSEIDFTLTSPTTTPNLTASIIAGSIANSKLTNSTISGVSLGGTLGTLTINSPLTGSSYNGSGGVSISIQDSVADGTTKGASTFTATDFNATSGVISIDYINGQAASTTNKGFLTATDWNTFNNKGSGSVSTVSVVSANGVSGSVATATTTPAITLTLGNITPTTVNGLTLASQSVGFTIAGGTTSKTLTVPLDATISGTNTGDQTITLTGDVTGTGTGSFATAIGAGKVTNTMLAGSIASSKLVGTDIATVGTITSGTWQGTAIADTYISSATNWNTAYTNRITSLTTTGSSGASTLISNTLNIPTYTLAGLGGVPTTTTVNGHALSSNVTVTADDVLPTQTGNNGKYLTTNGTTSSWGTISGTGDVVGPSSATDNAIARFDTTTGKLIQNSSASITDLGSLVLTAQASPTYVAGSLAYDAGSESLTFFNNDSNIGLQVGQEEWIRVKNVSGSTIANGKAVYINGTSTGLPTIALAKGDAAATVICAGLTTESIANNAIGYVTIMGVVHGLDTSAFTAGATVFVDATTAGSLTSTAPTAPNYRFRVGIVTVSDATVGAIHVTPSTGALGNGTANQVFGMNNAGTAQEVKTISGGTGISVVNTANTITVNNTTVGSSILLFGQTAAQTINTTTPTTLFGAGQGTLTIPASTLSAGRTLRVEVGGIYSTPIGNTATLSIAVKLGSTTIASGTANALLANASNAAYSGYIDIQCRTAGASGTVVVDGNVDYSVGNNLARFFLDLNNGGAATTVNTTISQVLDVVLTWSAVTTQTLTSTVATVMLHSPTSTLITTLSDGDKGDITVSSNGTVWSIDNGTVDLTTKVTGILPGANGGTGVANTGKTITLGGNLTTSGAFATTLTATATTGVTLPTTGTLATLAGVETFTNKTLTSSTNVLGGVTTTLGSDATGDIYYRNSSGFFTRLGIGSSTNVLTVSGGLPAWAAASGGSNPVIFSQTADAAAVNTTTETNLIGTGNGTSTLSAGLQNHIGDVVEIYSAGTFVMPGSGTGNIIFRLKYGATTLVTSQTLDISSATGVVVSGTGNYVMRAKVATRTTGASGTVMITGDIIISNLLSGNPSFPYSLSMKFDNAGTAVTVDLTASKAVTFTAQMSTAQATKGPTGKYCDIKYYATP